MTRTGPTHAFSELVALVVVAATQNAGAETPPKNGTFVPFVATKLSLMNKRVVTPP